MATKRDIEAYKKMTRSERRVAICKDVIKQLDAGRYIAYSAYLKMPSGGHQLVETKDNPISDKTCYLCGKGAMFVSKVSKFNGVGPFVPDKIREFNIVSGVSDAFSRDQMDTIEKLFERHLGFQDLVGGSEEDQFNWYFKSKEDRLRIICQNYIDNKGTLKPKQLPDYEVELI